MIKSLTLKNFRKHTEAEFNFSAGLTVVRGSSEAGKTTLAEAILYCFFGSSALRESLDKVVTYDCPESSLKAALVFSLDGVDYKIVRGKSGAELTYSNQLVTGQRETKLFVERLLGCTAETAKLLMFADQNSVRGVLSKGGTAANGLVETLAQLGVIEELIDKVQAQLPSGNTKAVESQVEALKGAVVKIPEMPTEDSRITINTQILGVQAKIDLSEARRPHEQDVANAAVAVQVSKAVQSELERLQTLKVRLSAELAAPVTAPGFTLEALTQARSDAANLPEQKRRWLSYGKVFPKIEDEWEGSIESAEAFKQDTASTIRALQVAQAELKTRIEISKVKKINEKACAFCKKDLTDVPEVKKLNLDADECIATDTAALLELEVSVVNLQAELACITKVLDTHSKVLNLANDCWDVGDRIPAQPVWVGEPPTKPGTRFLRGMEEAWAEYQNTIARRQLLQEQLVEIELPEVPDVSRDLAIIYEDTVANKEILELNSELEKLSAQLAIAKSEYDFKVQLREAAIKQAEANTRALQTLTETRDMMYKHNELIKKLRAARPKIAAEMWGTVLGAVSRYFTQIRGEESAVVRDADGFKVNGRNVEGLSGSTQDALGLAIRMALSKLFLPNVSMLFMDESFSGADRNREMNGVATLAAAGFSQVILVTHSDGPEQIADTLITI